MQICASVRKAKYIEIEPRTKILTAGLRQTQIRGLSYS